MPRTDPNAPADARMMVIAHEALRRDLRRARGVLTGSPSPARAQREALAAHLGWMMRFLHDHHVGEDEGLYPFVRERDPATTDGSSPTSEVSLIAPMVRSAGCPVDRRLTADAEAPNAG